MHNGIMQGTHQLNKNMEIAERIEEGDPASGKKRAQEAVNQYTNSVKLHQQHYTDEVKSLRSMRNAPFHSSLQTSADKLRSVVITEEVGKTAREVAGGWNPFGRGR